MLKPTNLFSYNSILQDDLQIKQDSKHNPPANKEWKNGVYTFNNSLTRQLAIKDSVASELIRSYFNLIPFQKGTKSKRMKDLIRRSTTRQIYISNAEVKQTNEKAIVTIYLFDREKNFVARRMLTWFKILKKVLIWNKLLIPRKASIKHFFKRNSYLYPYSLSQKMDNLKSSLLNEGVIKKRVFLKKLKIYVKVIQDISWTNYDIKNIYFEYYRWILSNVNINLRAERKQVGVTKKRNKNSYKNRAAAISGIYLIKDNVVLYHIDKKHLHNTLKIMIMFTWKYANLTAEKHKKLFFSYIINNKWGIKSRLYKMYKHAGVALSNLNYLRFNEMKMNKYVPYLKSLLAKIYNKRVELNIVSLRYLHLNSDILVQAMATKLRNKKSKVLTVIKKSLKLVQIKFGYKSTLKVKYQRNLKNKTLNYLELLNGYKGTNITRLLNNSEALNKLCNLLFSNKVKNNSIKYHVSKKIHKALLSVKYKWVTGICLLANGRLTKRYTASRAVHKIRYYGSLQNFDYLKVNTANIKPSAVLLRGINKPNIQNSYITGNRRIGAFGIKAWLSSN